MSDVLKRFAALEATRREQEAALSTTVAEMEEMRPLVVQAMQEMGLERAKVAGFNFSLRPRYFPTIKPDNYPKVVEYMRNNGWGDLVKETIHPSTLSSFVTEQIESGGLPPELGELITVAELQRVSVRK